MSEYDSWEDSLEDDRRSSSRGSSGKKWSLLWRPSEAPTKIHLSRPEKPYVHPTSGKELPFRAGERHFIPGKGKSRKGAFIECGVKRDMECVVDAYINPNAYGLTNVAPDANLAQHKARIYYAVAGWIEEDFHLVDVENQNDEGTHKERWRCLGRGCEYCQEGWPLVFGNRFYMEVSPGQWRHSFHDLHRKIENSYCRCGGRIYVPSFCCANCNKLVLDIATYCDCGGESVIDVDRGVAICETCGREWSAVYTDHQKLYEESNESYTCRDCGHRGFLRPTRICSEGCEVDPYGIFDCQLTVRMTGEKKERRLIIDSYTIQDPDPRLFDPEHQGNDEWAPKIVQAHETPLDLEQLLMPLPPDEQAKILEKPNPFNAVARGNRYAKYDAEGNEG